MRVFGSETISHNREHYWMKLTFEATHTSHVRHECYDCEAECSKCWKAHPAQYIQEISECTPASFVRLALSQSVVLSLEIARCHFPTGVPSCTCFITFRILFLSASAAPEIGGNVKTFCVRCILFEAGEKRAKYRRCSRGFRQDIFCNANTVYDRQKLYWTVNWRKPFMFLCQKKK